MTASTPAHGDLQTGPLDGAPGGSDLPTGAADVPAGPSDAELLAAARIGDAEAYAELFRRHSPAARALARHLTRHESDADDLVSEAFTKVLNALRNGNGPTVALRPYLLTAVRRVHVDRAVAVQRVQPVEDVTVFDPGEPFVDPALAGLERTLVARAYGQLPERWQTVLWHTEVEGMSPREVAPLLGMSPNAVSALALRARSGLRDAYLAAHVPDPRRRGCEATLPRLAAYVRGSTSDRETAQVQSHLDTCDDCRDVLAELRDVGVGMRGVIAPLVLGLAAPAYMAKIAALGGAAAAGAGIAGSSTTGGTSVAGTTAAGTSAAGASATAAGGAGAAGAGAAATGAGSGGLAGLISAGTAGGWLAAGAAVVTLGVAAFAVHTLVTGEDDGRPAAAATADTSGGSASDAADDPASLDADASVDDGALAEPGTAAALPGDGGQVVVEVPGAAAPVGDPAAGTGAGTAISGDTTSGGRAPGGAASAGATGPGTGAGDGTSPSTGSGPGTAPGTAGPGTGARPGPGTTTPPPAEPPRPAAPAPSALSLATTTLPSGQESALDVRISGPAAQATRGVLHVTVPDRIRLVATGCTVDGRTATCDLDALDGSDAFSVVVRANEPGSYDVALELRATNAGGTTTSTAVVTVSVRPGGHVTP